MHNAVPNTSGFSSSKAACKQPSTWSFTSAKSAIGSSKLKHELDERPTLLSPLAIQQLVQIATYIAINDTSTHTVISIVSSNATNSKMGESASHNEKNELAKKQKKTSWAKWQQKLLVFIILREHQGFN